MSISGRGRGDGMKLSRRELLTLAAAGVAAGSTSGWFETLADVAAGDVARRKSCILLWMSGGPSQLDTFDLKPGHANGGEFKPIQTSVPEIRVSEHLPQVARQMDDLAIIRSMSTKEGDHGRATFHLRTGYMPSGPIQYPCLGALVSKEFERDDAELPNFISINPMRAFNSAAFGPGFLGPRYTPLIVGDGQYFGGGGSDYEQRLKVEDIEPPPSVSRRIADARLGLLESFESDFQARHADLAAAGHQLAYKRAVRMMRSKAVEAFKLTDEPSALRDAYGRNQFGQSCLLARRLVERGVPFVEVSLSGVEGSQFLGWDTHQQNFDIVKKLSQVLDPAWATLMRDLKSRGLLESTLIVWMGEFGRTPAIQNGGRDHFPGAWTTVLGGGGIKGGQVIGKTSDDGVQVTERPVTVPDFMSTVCRALGIDPMKQNMSDVGRPIRIAAPEAKPIVEVLA